MFFSQVLFKKNMLSQITLIARKSTSSLFWYQHLRSLWCTKWLDWLGRFGKYMDFNV